jgi:hypothetical protein
LVGAEDFDHPRYTRRNMPAAKQAYCLLPRSFLPQEKVRDPGSQFAVIALYSL